MSENLNTKIKSATKWSAITEVALRLVLPIINMVLARVLTPDAFGIVATLTMIITFAEIFTDAGFQKYIVQHQFINDKDKIESVNVAFWSNFGLSITIWLLIIFFCNPIAKIVGNEGMGYVIAIACVNIPIAAFSSIQSALYKRDLDFKTLFKVRIIGVAVPLIVTLPLAFWLKSFWALVIGTIVQNALNAILLTTYSKWKPSLFYSFSKLKEMFSFTVWSMIEQVSIWLTLNVDIFIVGVTLSQHYLGLYKTSSGLVSQIMGLVTAATTPVLFSSLSKVQTDKSGFENVFLRFQKVVSILAIPLGVGIFLFSGFVTEIILGDQWLESSGFVGLWGLTNAVTIVLAQFCSEAYRALGKPQLSVLVQWGHIIVLWPTVLITVKYGFEVLYVSRALVRLEIILVNILVMYYCLKFPIGRLLTNILPSISASAVMAIVFYLLPAPQSILQNFVQILICALTYLAFISLFKDERLILFNLKKYIKH